MLKFNPDDRLSAKDLLSNNMFDPIRIKKIEKGAPYKLYVDEQSFGWSQPEFQRMDSEQKKQIYRNEIIQIANQYR